MPNRLAGETSPYLLQHKNNPVDWYPWGEEAFQAAKERAVPVFLSIGYSSCHWCHVMAHESFEDPDTARLMNELFVNVKVDREERPDIDEAYMTFVQLVSGRGGWPTSVFLTPSRDPFFGGTYWPNLDRAGYAGFRTICAEMGRLWTSKRTEVVEAAEQYGLSIGEALHSPAPTALSKLSEQFLGAAVEVLGRGFDEVHGGFGRAPKFPPHTAIDFLLSYAQRESASMESRELALRIASVTLEKMALGGIRDHVGGGFHRYSTDGDWLLPHWEKMLYDNALLLASYSQAARVFAEGRPGLASLCSRVSDEIVGWLEREMSSKEGCFYSALDADTKEGEGAFYVWSLEELLQLPGGDELAKAYGCLPRGNFADEATHRPTGKNIFHLKGDIGVRFRPQLDTLLTTRDERPKPGPDGKALVGWNGLAIAGLASAGRLDRAIRAAEALLAAERSFGKLPHQISGGVPSGLAFLEDYAYLSHGLLELAAALERSADGRAGQWRAEGTRLGQEMVGRFYDGEGGGFFSTSLSHEKLFGRSKPVMDQPLPSGNATAVRVLLAMGDRAKAGKTLDAFLGWMERAPHGTEALHAAALVFCHPD